MEQKYFKPVFIISLVISVMGMFSEIFDYFNFKSHETSKLNEIIQYGLWIFRVLYVYIGFERNSINVYNLIFYTLLFFGSIFFYISKGKELRLIRFFYSVAVITNIFMVVRIILGNTVFKTDLQISSEYHTQILISKIIGFLLTMFDVFLGYKILKILSAGRELDITKKANSESVIITETPKTDRFLHLFFDTVIIVFIMFSMLDLVVSYYRFQSVKIQEWLGNRYLLIIILAIIRFIYYPFFEKIFGATPGKFLTDSRIINAKSEIPDTVTIFQRTLFRHIPFDAFSFFGSRGWHDSFSETYIVKEKQNGVPAGYMIWTFVLCAAIFCCYLYEIFINKF